jgi:lipopolysaccharide export system protein LptA
LAKGNVLLKKDGLTLKANIVKADYALENGENVLKKITAKEKVVLTKDKSEANGQFMTYDVVKEIAIISGPFQTLSSPAGYVESKKIIMFDDLKNKTESNIIIFFDSTYHAGDERVWNGPDIIAISFTTS